MARLCRGRVKKASVHPLESLAVFMIATAEDEEDYCTGLLMAQLSLSQRRKNSGRFGPRGLYDRVKSTDFFDLLLHQFSDHQFKNWLRCMTPYFIHVTIIIYYYNQDVSGCF